MAEDYSSQTAFPYIQRVTLGSSNMLTEIKLPAKGRKVTILWETNAGKLAHTGTDTAAIGTEFFTVPADSAIEIVYSMGVSAGSELSLYAASATGSTVICVLLEGKVDLEERS